jgi:hypothetical protein
MFAARGQNYRTLWDARIGTFRPRTEDGAWMDPYDPATGNEQFHESGAYQYQWLVPQDPKGMISLLGGTTVANDRLDEFFAYDKLLADAERTARTEWVNSAYNYYGATTYNPNNEPDLLSPYTYLWTGEPYKAATVVRAAETLFTNGPDGMTGNDDLGTMSAWYVFSSLGLYPTMSGAGFYGVSSPQFPQAKLQIGSYGRQGGTLTISAPGASADNRYIRTAALDGRAFTRTYLRHNEIQRGGRLDYALATAPGSWGTRPGDAPPSVNGGAPFAVTDLSGRLSPADALVPPSADKQQTARLNVDLVVTHEGSTTVSVAASAPRDFAVTPTKTTTTVTAHGAPASARVPLTVTVPAGTPEGEYPVTVTAKMPGADPITRKATVTVRLGSCASAPAGFCPLDLGRDYNHDGVATLDATDQGNFDGGGWSYAANLLPSKGPVTIGGIPYEAPSTAGTDANFVEARGQSLAVPEGGWKTAYVLGATHNGNVDSAATVTYADASADTVPLQLTDWAGGPAFGNAKVIAMDYRIKAGQGQDGPPVAIFGTELALDPAKTVRSITLPTDTRMEVYALTLAGP